MTAPGFTEEWFCQESQDVLANLVRIVEPLDGLIIEVGAWEGRSTVALANAAHPRVVHSCDTWQGSGHEISEKLAAERDIFAQWQANVDAMTDGNVKPYRMGWRDFVPTITEPIALAFVDAEHSYVEVRDNIEALLPLMAPGGIICGDDAHHGPVKQAVLDMLGEAHVVATLWVWQMPVDYWDEARLAVEHPGILPTGEQWAEARSAVAPIWQDYVENVSGAGHAASPQTCALLWHLCRTLRPAKVLDLGSGISSVVMRLAGAEVHSYDTDREWLDKTERFLVEQRIDTERMHLVPPTPAVLEGGGFDLVFHDLAGGTTRNEWAEFAARALKPGGVIVFDDDHHADHHTAYEAAAERNGVTTYSMRERTTDLIKRWSMLGIKDKVQGPTLADLYAEQCRTPSDIWLHLPRMVALVEALDAEHVIELGTRTGVSTIAWLHALEQTGGHLTSVDLDAKPPIGDWPHWTFIQADDMNPDLYIPKADIVFLDTSHHYGHTVAELDRILAEWVRPGGIICLHDTELEWPEGAAVADGPFPVKRALSEFIDRHGFECINYPDSWGFAIVKVG